MLRTASGVCLPPYQLPVLPTLDIIHKFIRDKYSKRFPELESLVPNALDYIRTVKVSGQRWGLRNSGVLLTTPHVKGSREQVNDLECG